MSETVIRCEGLSKLYRIGERESYGTLRDTIIKAVSTPYNRLRNRNGDSAARNVNADRAFWALKDVAFEVKQGQVVGIIGRNGAGKSTLLKILSRITKPTTGAIEIHGRIGSLLEVGTGFHPELTGRENIYLNGAILGMKKTEIERKFDEIVAFAEVDRFLDTPVKRFSSGMYMRLAFAVAAHLEPEILLVDEVLAVGDAAFQAKCLGKIGDVAREGRTVLFVSHNLGSMANLCSRAILLVQGRKWSDGPAGEVISEYISIGKESLGECIWNEMEEAPGNENVRLHAVRVVSRGEITTEVDIQEDVHIEVEFWNLKPDAQLCTSIHLLDKMGVGVLASANMHSANLIRDEWFGKPHPIGLYRTACTIPGNFLNEGRYQINAVVLTDILNIEVIAREVISFTVHDTGAMRQEYGGGWLGVVRPKLAWQTVYLQPIDEALSGEKAF
jgi:lipopolysaccharide transport system ATP-binding protein